jgi:acyl-CoA dehydrogenase
MSLPPSHHTVLAHLIQAERALEWFLARLSDPAKKPFGKKLAEHGVMLERVARSRIEIDSARLAVLNAAIKIDEGDAKDALKEISEVKVQVPSMLLDVIDRAMQAYGGAGVSQDTPLASMWASGRTMRIVDGPDEVHILQLGRNESKRGDALRSKIEAQKGKTAQLFEQYGMKEVDALQLNRVSGKAKL